MAAIGTKEAAERLGLKQNTVSKLCREGKIKGAEQDSNCLLYTSPSPRDRG